MAATNEHVEAVQLLLVQCNARPFTQAAHAQTSLRAIWLLVAECYLNPIRWNLQNAVEIV